MKCCVLFVSFVRSFVGGGGVGLLLRVVFVRGGTCVHEGCAVCAFDLFEITCLLNSVFD